MPLIDFLKKIKKTKKERKTKEKEAKELKKKEEALSIKPKKLKEEMKRAIKKKDSKKEKSKGTEDFPFVLKSHHISEKATELAKKNQYLFKVYSKANKIEIKKAIENLYGVNVLSVNIIKIPAKKRRRRRISGFKKGYKKAIVKIKEGQKIEVL